MIKTVKVTNSYGSSLTMTLDNPYESGYAITGISGLEPPTVDIKQTQMISGLRYKYNFGFHKYREISITIVYIDYNKSVAELREELYTYFKTNDHVVLEFEKDVRGTIKRFFIDGYVSEHQSVVFASDCGCTIKVLCPDPWFKTKNPDEVKEYTTLQFEENNYTNPDIYKINYPGDMENGFIICSKIEHDGLKVEDHYGYFTVEDEDYYEKSNYTIYGDSNEIWIRIKPTSGNDNFWLLKGRFNQDNSFYITNIYMSDGVTPVEFTTPYNCTIQAYNDLTEDRYLISVFDNKLIELSGHINEHNRLIISNSSNNHFYIWGLIGSNGDELSLINCILECSQPDSLSGSLDKKTLELSTYIAHLENNEEIIDSETGKLKLFVKIPESIPNNSELYIDLTKDEIKIYIEYLDITTNEYKIINCISFIDSTILSDRKIKIPKLYSSDSPEIYNGVKLCVVNAGTETVVGSILKYNILRRGL